MLYVYNSTHPAKGHIHHQDVEEFVFKSTFKEDYSGYNSEKKPWISHMVTTC